MNHSDVEELAVKAGMQSALNMGAASCAWTEGCEGVSQQHLERFAALVLEKAAHAANHEDHITVRFPGCGALQGRETQCSIVKELRQMSAALQAQ